VIYSVTVGSMVGSMVGPFIHKQGREESRRNEILGGIKEE